MSRPSRSLLWILTVCAAVLPLLACGGGDDGPSAPPAFQLPEGYDPAMARTMATQSMQAPGPDAALTVLGPATDLAPTMVDPWLLTAMRRVEMGDVEGAFAALDRVAALGMRVPVERLASLQSLHADPRWQELVTRLDAFGAPKGTSDVVATLEDPAMLAEGVAWDAQTGAYFVSAVHGRKIVRIAADGAVEDWFGVGKGDENVFGVFGLVADAERRRLWGTTSGLPQMRDFDPSLDRNSALLEIDLDSGELVARYDLPKPMQDAQAGTPGPPGTNGHRLNDVALAADGTVYASDLLTPGGVFRLVPGAASLEPVAAGMPRNSPQGLALLGDDSILVVADYSFGLVATDLGSGEFWYVEPPDDLFLQTLDGLTAMGDGSLIAIQNGPYPPHRILHLVLSDDRRSIASWTVLAAALPEWNEPTLGTLVEQDGVRRFVYVANSQWALFPENAVPDAAQLEAPRLMSIDLGTAGPG